MGKSKQPKSLNLAVIFLAVFALLVLISVALKIVNVFQKSKFDGKNHFILSVVNKTDDVSLITLSPKNSTIYILSVKDGKHKDLSKALEIPIDGEIYTGAKINEENIKTEFFKFLMPFSIDKTKLNSVDMFRLWLCVNFVPVNSIYEREISINDDKTMLKNSGAYSYFVDQGIAEEKVPIEIVNGTNVFGLGNRLASYLSNIGANIIMVSTSEKEEAKSRIDYLDQESYTLKKLVGVLEFKPNLIKKKRLGNITIVIGRDALSQIKF